jgi:hypothetical protein
VQRALLDRFVEGGDRSAIGLLGGRFVALGYGFAQIAKLRAVRCSVWRARFTAERWFAMSGSLPSCDLERYSGGSELLIIGERFWAVKLARNLKTFATEDTESHRGIRNLQ